MQTRHISTDTHPTGGREIQYWAGLNINGVWQEDPEVVKDEVMRFFISKFSSEDTLNIRFPITPSKTISDFDKCWLEREFSMEEIKNAVWECGSDKAPGPDGFNFQIIESL